MQSKFNLLAKIALCLAISLSFSASVQAVPFTIANGVIETSPQTLADDETGAIETTGQLNTAGATAITALGINNVVNNGGTISTTGDSAIGIFSSGADANNATINNSGSISTAGDSAMGIASQSVDATINNSGSILTTGDEANGIFSSGNNSNNANNATINNSGSISTAGATAVGIRSQGADATITNSGRISTAGATAVGIFSSGNNTTINNSDTISTAGSVAHGITSQRDNATINNSGGISTTGDDAIGITSIGNTTFSANNATINNSGTISTTGGGALGMFVAGADATIINSGTISTTGGISAAGATSHGIASIGVDATIINSGTISTTRDNALGIFSAGANSNNATVINSGTISTTGGNAFGIISQGDNATVNNSGGISTTGDNAHGIVSVDNTGVNNANNATINSSGTISTTGATAIGIFSAGTNATINNSSSISTTGDGAGGIYSAGDNATINNSGLIYATGDNSFAISGDVSNTTNTNNITLNLLPGSIIIGRIGLGSGSDSDTANVYAGAGASSRITFINTENINLLGGVVGVKLGNSVVTVDATAESSRSVVLSGLTASVHNVVSQRLAHTTPLKPVQPDLLFQERAPVAWAQVLGGMFNRGGEGDALGYETSHLGFNLGYEWEGGSTTKPRVGLIGGVAQSDTESDISAFQTDVNSYFLGTYGHFNVGFANLTTSIITGYGDHDNERLVIDNENGLEVARSDVNSFFLSPSVTLSSAFSATDKIELRPSATISYSIAWMGGYTEQGTTGSNLDVDGRTLGALTAKLQLAAAAKPNEASELELRVGANSRHSDNQSIHVSISGNNFSYNNVDDDSVLGFVGANIVATDDNLSLIADVEYGKGSDEDNLTGYLSLKYAF